MAVAMETCAARVLEWLRDERAAMTDLLMRLAVSESPSSAPAAQAGVQGELARGLRSMGYRVRHLSGERTGGQVLAVPASRSRGPFQLVLGHSDTVWPLGTCADMPVEVRGGRLYGPGVYDMKAGLVQALFALRALVALGETPAVTPVVLVSSDEEIGSPESKRHIRRLACRSDRALVLEPSLGPEGRLKTRRKGVGGFRITIHGRAAHAGLEPELGRSAILELSHVVQRLFELNDPARGISVNVGTIDGGLRANVVAPTSRARVDVRAWSAEDASYVERRIRSLQPVTPGTRIEVEGGFGRPPMERTPGTERLWQAARRAASQLGLRLEEGAAGGGSDGNVTSRLTPTLDGLGAVGGGAHHVDEHVEIDRMPERAAILALLLVEAPLSAGGAGPSGGAAS